MNYAAAVLKITLDTHRVEYGRGYSMRWDSRCAPENSRHYCTVKVVVPETWVKIEFTMTFIVA